MSAAACGEGESSDAGEAAGTYTVDIAKTEFPIKQRLGETSLLQIGVHNTDKKTIPTLTVTISIAGEEGQTSSLPFGIHDQRPGLAQPDRPVWVLSAGYPKLAGSDEPGGTSTSNPKTFAFGPLEPGDTTEAVWKLSAVKAGNYVLRYRVNAGLSGKATAETTGAGVKPRGAFPVEISSVTPNTKVTDSGEVVEIGESKRGGQ